MVSPPSPRYFSHKGGCSPGIILLLFFSHSLLHCKTQEFACSPFLSVPFTRHLPPQWHSTPGLSSRRAAAPPDPSRVPALGSVPPLGRYGMLEPTTSNAETVPGVVYWPGSSILSLHNYGFSTQERGKKKYLQH